MVRLKAFQHKQPVLHTKFQFHYGTIKSSRADLATKPLHYFNSTMVRLKERERLGFRHTKNLFQFHYGTIKRAETALYTGAVNSFQFHYGTIKRSWIWYAPSFWHISIPLWYD